VTPTFSYELATHAHLTYAALQRSQLYADPLGIFNLGITKGWRTDLGDTYLDPDVVQVAIRRVWPYDYNQDKMPAQDTAGLAPEKYRNLPHGWLMSGAIREDDASWSTQFLNTKIFDAQPEPHDDPWGNFNRFCNHFFDPYRNSAFTGTCPSDEAVVTAPIWAIGVHGPFAIPLITPANPVRRNHFTVVDAREAMWQALTGKDKGGNVVASDELARLRRWATMFRALGDVLHLNQDMAQPQHTRDEGHGLGHAAWYEKYIDGRAKGASSVKYSWPFGTLTADNLEPLNFNGYPTPRFASFAEFWSTGLGTASFTGKGLADYSSRGFFTPEKNFGRIDFPRPVSEYSAYQQSLIGQTTTGRAMYLDAPVYDAYTNSSSGPIHMTRASLIDDSLTGSSGGGRPPFDGATFTLDRVTFDDRAELLIPRAVAYSAGLLDHFFRGTMTIMPPDEGVYAMVDHSVEKVRDTGGFSTIRLKVANSTTDEAMSRGMIVAVLKYHLDNCYVDDLSGAPTTFQEAVQCRSEVESVTVSDPIDLPDGLSTTPVQFTFQFSSKLPINSTSVLLQIVYRGVLGQEADAVVVAAKDLSEPTFFTYHNATDFTRIGEHVYTRAEINTSAQLLSQVSPQNCVDYTQNPPQLRSGCLEPIAINMVLAAGSGQTATIQALPERRFARMAFLAGDTNTTLSQQRFTCLPPDPFIVLNYQWQLVNDPYGVNPPTMYYGTYWPLRGVKGWFQAACVLSGDGSLEISNDDRNERLDAVSEKYPFPMQITPP
jgi:hypothetical protein